VPQADWHDAKVKSPANCAACHTRAAEGSYREREIVMPNGKKWE
jgi:mono/diheme cytochrome c family protein